ncbi:MAG: TorA maturation chaperone TorD [Myxococcota bacterium]
MDPVDIARARHRLYGLLGQLLVDGPTDALADTVAALPALADAWPAGDADARQATHHRVFGLEVFPYESVFVGADGVMGGDATGALRRDLQAAGFRGGRTDVEVDHVGLELAALSWLCAAEAEALEDDVDPAPARAHQARLLHRHVARWLPALSLAVHGLDPWTQRVLALAEELVAAHCTALGPTPGWTLPPRPDDLLDDRRTGLARIARAWLVPAHSGWALSRQSIGRLAARAGVPSGFGPRWKMLEGVLAGAVDHDSADAALDALADELARWRDGYARAEALGLPIGPWRTRLAATEGELSRIRDAV